MLKIRVIFLIFDRLIVLIMRAFILANEFIDEHTILLCVTLIDNYSDTWWKPSMKIKTCVVIVKNVNFNKIVSVPCNFRYNSSYFKTPAKLYIQS